MCDFLEGLRTEGFVLCEEVLKFYREACNQHQAEAALRAWAASSVVEPEIPGELLKKAAAFTDTAAIILGRRQGENADRNKELFYLKLEVQLFP